MTIQWQTMYEVKQQERTEIEKSALSYNIIDWWKLLDKPGLTDDENYWRRELWSLLRGAMLVADCGGSKNNHALYEELETLFYVSMERN